MGAAAPEDFILLPEPWRGAPAAMISLRVAGDMGLRDPSNEARRSAWLYARGFDPERAAYPDMSHSRDVVEVHDAKAARGVAADGMVCAGLESRACLLITVADCVPIFVYDRGSGAFGLLHSGWKGTGILAEGLRAIASRFGSRPSDIAITLGPSIGVCCYRVDEKRAAAFEAEFGSGAVRRDDNGARLDLVEANKAIAAKAGIGSVLALGICTACDERFGSYRREGPGGFTRMAAVLGFPASAREVRR